MFEEAKFEDGDTEQLTYKVRREALGSALNAGVCEDDDALSTAKGSGQFHRSHRARQSGHGSTLCG